MRQPELWASLAETLERARIERCSVRPLTEDVGDLTVEDAYWIQLEGLRKRLGQGRRLVGHKIGLTSRAMQEMFGVDQPDYGYLLDDMEAPNEGSVSAARFLQPRVEGELAFVLRKGLGGPGVGEEDVLAATESIVPAIEIVDSRIRDWKIKIADTVADNASSGMFVLGESRRSARDLDLPGVEMVLEKNGKVVLSGNGAAVLGHPATSVAWLANKLCELGTSLRAGEVILSGSLAAAVPVAQGDTVKARFGDLGSVQLSFS